MRLQCLIDAGCWESGRHGFRCRESEAQQRMAAIYEAADRRLEKAADMTIIADLGCGACYRYEPDGFISGVGTSSTLTVGASMRLDTAGKTYEATSEVVARV